MGMKCVVTGAVACGTKTASKLRRLSKDPEIVLIDKNDTISYGACGLPYYLSGQIEEIEKLYMSRKGPRDKKYFEKEKNIDRVLTDTEVIKIDREKKIIQIKDLNNGKVTMEGYDKLVLATGADPVRPPIEGIDSENIFNLKKPSDAVKIRELLRSGEIKTPVILGAGLIGIEVAEALSGMDLPVKMVDMADTVLSALFDKEMTDDIHSKLTEDGVELILKAAVTKFISDKNGKVSGMIINDEIIRTDLVILAAGFKPATKIAVQAGLNTAKNGALIVDKFMRTSDPDIYAGGDCVMNINRITKQLQYAPLGDLANIHGRIIAKNIYENNSTKFDGIVGNAVTKFRELNIGSCGITEKQAVGLGYNTSSCIINAPDRAGYYPGRKKMKIKMISDKKSSRILGIQAVGEGDVSKLLNTMSMGLASGIKINGMANSDLAYSPAFSPSLDALIVAANVLDKNN